MEKISIALPGRQGYFLRKLPFMVRENTMQHFKKELDGWAGMINIFQQENVHLKSLLSELVNASCENDKLFFAESYLEEFISLDKMIDFLQEELRLQSQLLQKRNSNDGQWYLRLNENQQSLREDFIKAEKSFLKVKSSFAKYLEKGEG